MGEKFNCEELVKQNRSWLSSAIFNLIGDQYKNIFSKEEKIIDIELKFNGVNVSFNNFIEHLAFCYEEQVKQAAFLLIEEKINSAMNIIEKFSEDAKLFAKIKLDFWDENS